QNTTTTKIIQNLHSFSIQIMNNPQNMWPIPLNQSFHSINLILNYLDTPHKIKRSLNNL
ncbi:8572_t:CDS:1, partial [Scutellospora calospora]